MAQANVKAVITAEDRASAALKGFGNKVSSVGSKIASSMKVAALAAGAATAALITFSLNQFRDIQKNVAGIQALTKNTKEAKRVLKDAIDFVQGKPFDRLDTIGAAKQLLAFGRTANQIKGDLKTLGNTVLVSGIDWTNLTRVYGRVVASGKLLREDFNILNDAGVGLAKTLQEELGTNMQGVFEKMEDGEISAEIFQRALKKAAPDAATEKALNTFDNKLLSLKAKFRDIGFAILGVDFNEMSESGEPLVKEGGLLDRLTDGMDALTLALQNPGAVGGIGKIFRAFTVLGSYLSNVLSSAVNIVRQGLNLLQPVFSYLGKVVNTELMPALRRLWVQLGPLLGPTARALGAVLGGVLIASIVALTGILIGASRIITRFANALASAISWARSFADGVSNAARAVGPAVKKGVSSAVSAVWNFYGQFVDAGWGLVRGLANGIKDAAGEAVEAAKGVARDAINGAKNILGISSPSKVFAGIGKNLVRGFASGIKSESDLATQAVSSLTSGLNPQLLNATPGANGMGFAQGGTSLVGENGPELVNLPRGSRVMPNDKTEKVMRNNQPTVNITIQAGAFMGSQQDARKYAEMIFRAYKDLVTANPSRAVI